MAALSAQRKKISIHALREEGDAKRPDIDGFSVPISIHALREEGDWSLSGQTAAF